MKPPVQFDPSMSLEDDVALQAIEALEAQSVDPNPKPLIPDESTVIPEVGIAPAPPAPVQPQPVAPTPQPQPIITPTPAPVVQPTLSDPASKMAAELANAPTKVQTFHFFITQKRHIQPALLAILIIVAVAAAAGIYYVVQTTA